MAGNRERHFRHHMYLKGTATCGRPSFLSLTRMAEASICQPPPGKAEAQNLRQAYFHAHTQISYRKGNYTQKANKFRRKQVIIHIAKIPFAIQKELPQGTFKWEMPWERLKYH